MNEDFKAFGQVLRFPIFLVGVAFWTIYIFPFIFGFTLIVVICHPVFVPPLYGLAYLVAAFAGAKEPPDWNAYWIDYPMVYVRWLQVGYRGMYRWLIEGSGC